MFSLFAKRDCTATITPSSDVVSVKRGAKLLDAALAAGLAWPHDCRVGSCGACRCRLTHGKIKPLTDFSYTLTAEELKGGVILACQAHLRSDVTVEVALGMPKSGTGAVSGTIESQRALTHDILEVTVRLAEPTFADAAAGQYLELKVEGIDVPRSYSLLRSPRNEPEARVTFCIRHVPGGAFTDWLFATNREGCTLTLAGPFGAFHYHSSSGHMVCVAGGSGLAPLHAILQDCCAADVARDCTVLFGARTSADLYYLDELAALGARWRGRFSVLPVLSLEPPGSAWQGLRGLVTDALGPLAGSGFDSGDQGYLCGPPAMVDAGVAELRRLGMRAEAIFCDRFLDASTRPGGRDTPAVAGAG